MKKPLLVGAEGCGSVIVECAFNLAGIEYDYEEVDYSADSPTRPRLLSLNPLGQVPTLVLPDGRVVAESLAMIHWAQDRSPHAPLVPPPGDPRREDFYRWAAFIVAALYPTWTYGDDPRKWLDGDEAAAKKLRASTDEHRKRLLKQMQAACGAPHFLGERFSAIDLYMAAMSQWRPGNDWWVAEVPKLAAVAKAAMARPEVAKVLG